MFPLLELLQVDSAVRAEQCIIAGLPSCDLQDGAPAVPAQGAGGRGVAGDAGGGEGHQEGAGEAQGGGKKEGGKHEVNRRNFKELKARVGDETMMKVRIWSNI